MQRHAISARHNWREKVESVGLVYHTHDSGPYWLESFCYELTASEVAALESAANTLHGLCLQAAEAVVENNWWNRLAIPEAAIPVIRDSWERDQFSLYGRFDLAFDGRTPPKLLEYNADTPTALIEAAVAQWFWLRDCLPTADQFNSIHERLLAAWKRFSLGPVHFSAIADHPEDEQTVLYLQDTCHQAGGQTERISIAEIGWCERRRAFVDAGGAPIATLFKLYPWEWLWREEFGAHLAKTSMQWIEPPWKMLLSNKALLPVLWELFPEHPNLLPTYDSPEPLGNSFVKKPRLSREGANVTLVEGGEVTEASGGGYGAEGFIYQALAPLPCFEGNYPVFGAWIVDHAAAGVGIREDCRRITGNCSCFVPHYF